MKITPICDAEHLIPEPRALMCCSDSLHPLERLSTRMLNLDLFPFSHKSVSEVGHWCWEIRPSSQSAFRFNPKLFDGVEVGALIKSFQTKFGKLLLYEPTLCTGALSFSKKTCWWHLWKVRGWAKLSSGDHKRTAIFATVPNSLYNNIQHKYSVYYQIRHKWAECKMHTKSQSLFCSKDRHRGSQVSRQTASWQGGTVSKPALVTLMSLQHIWSTKKLPFSWEELTIQHGVWTWQFLNISEAPFRSNIFEPAALLENLVLCWFHFWLISVQTIKLIKSSQQCVFVFVCAHARDGKLISSFAAKSIYYSSRCSLFRWLSFILNSLESEGKMLLCPYLQSKWRTQPEDWCTSNMRCPINRAIIFLTQNMKRIIHLTSGLLGFLCP